MTTPISNTEQIRQFHAQFINAVAEACLKPDERNDLEPLLKQAEQAGWKDLDWYSRNPCAQTGIFMAGADRQQPKVFGC